MFNTCGASGSPGGIYICGEYRGYNARRQKLSWDYSVCHERKRERRRPKNATWWWESQMCVRVAISQALYVRTH